MIEEIKQVLDLGLIIESKNYKMSKTNWGNNTDWGKEYAIESIDGGLDYVHDTKDDKSYIKAIKLLLNDK